MRSIYYNAAIREAIAEEMRLDDNLIIFGQDIAKYGGMYRVTQGLVEEFGSKRVRNSPISEAAMTGAAIGASMMGVRTIVEIMFMDWIGITLEQIVNNAAALRYAYGGNVQVPMVLRCPAGVYGGGAAHHSKSLEAWFTHIPGLKVIMPSTPYDAKGLLKSAIRDNNPVIFIENKLLYGTVGEVPEGEYTVEIGKADVKKIGEDVSIIATSRMVNLALEAAIELEKEGISCEVVDIRTLVPLDKQCIVDSVRKTHRALVVHESWKTCGYGAEISATLMEEAFDFLDAPVQRLAGLDCHIPFSPPLEKEVIPNKIKIMDAIRNLKKQ